MTFFENVKIFRSNSEIDFKLKILLKLYPQKYQNISHVIRSAILNLYRNEVDEHGRRKDKNSAFEFNN